MCRSRPASACCSLSLCFRTITLRRPPRRDTASRRRRCLRCLSLYALPSLVSFPRAQLRPIPLRNRRSRNVHRVAACSVVSTPAIMFNNSNTMFALRTITKLHCHVLRRQRTNAQRYLSGVFCVSPRRLPLARLRPVTSAHDPSSFPHCPQAIE
jgi:hypothetical protein